MRDIDSRLRSICICKRSMQLILNYTDYMFETKGSMQLIAWLSIVRQIIKYTFIYPQNLFLQQKDQLSVTSIVTNCTNKTFVSVASMKNYNFLDGDWFKKKPFSTISLDVMLSDSFLSDSFNKPITFKVVVWKSTNHIPFDCNQFQSYMKQFKPPLPVFPCNFSFLS